MHLLVKLRSSLTSLESMVLFNCFILLLFCKAYIISRLKLNPQKREKNKESYYLALHISKKRYVSFCGWILILR
jgi:hypothetical protein